MTWIIGSRGMAGTELCLRFQRQGLPFVGSDREVDITRPSDLAAFVRGKDVQWVVNCAAYTAVDKAEEEAEACARLNALGPENIARLCSEIGAGMIHLSTDYVFDGSGQRPYAEDDPVNPGCVYGRTKADGEVKVRALCPHSYIIRTAWLYGRHGTNFVLTMLKLMKERASIKVVSDQRGTPTFAADLADAISEIVRSERNAFGTFHFTNLGDTTWHGFALAIKDEAQAAGVLSGDCVVNPVTSDQYPTKARRPAYSLLAKDKIMSTFAISIPHWRESLHRFFAELSQKEPL
jgi:dTDP-4-dehydrorhamnose reductase